MKLTVIIPTLNEGKLIDGLLTQLCKIESSNVAEIIVVDGGSSDDTIAKVAKHDVKLIKSSAGRAKQMNKAAEESIGDTLYFIHADTRPLGSFPADIMKALDEGYHIGCYRFKFDSKNLRLKINSFFTRMNVLMMRGGDQTLFITKRFFNELNGFDESYVIMEDFDLIRRARKLRKFKIIDKSVSVSARKYKKNAYLKVQVVNLLAFLMFYCGTAPHKIRQMYHRFLKF